MAIIPQIKKTINENGKKTDSVIFSKTGNDLM